MSDFSIAIPQHLAQTGITVTTATLNAYLGKHIKDVCKCEMTSNGLNHCAHFVSHVMDYQFGYTCFKHTGKGVKTDQANMRVQEVFPQCPTVGKWADKPATLKKGLAFITSKNNVNIKNKTMVNVPKKHIGIFIDDTIWHYSNSKKKVVSQTSADFSKHYSGSSITVFYGDFPK